MDSRRIDNNPNYTTTPPLILNKVDSPDRKEEDHNRNPSVSTVYSYSQRDSRVQSIYDRYLYRQESKRLARNPSAVSTKSRKGIKRLASIKEMSRSASSRKKRQSVAMTNRESKPENSAWAGMMMGNVSSDESDSELSETEDKPAPSTSTKKFTPTDRARASWSSRAVAVGSRPPDSASQNPPTLKLLGLKSVKDGGAPIGFSSSRSPSPHLDVKQQQQQQQQSRNANPAFDMVAEGKKGGNADRIVSTSDYGDDAGRHGSYIEFGDASKKTLASPTRGYQLHDGPVHQAPSSLVPPVSANAREPLSPRTALTQELGLNTPQPAPSQSTGYFPPASQSSAPRNLMQASQIRQQIERSPQAPMPIMAPAPAQSIQLQRGSPPPIDIRPAPSNLTQMRSPIGAAPSPMPIPLPSPVYPPSAGAPLMGNPPAYYNERPSIDTRRGPASGPGFSDSPQVGGRQMARKPSLLRRSMAFMTGSNLAPPHQRQPSAGMGKKGLWRRSMAILTNRPIQPAAIPVQDDLDSPLPRVAGFLDEKPKSRKSEYLGASGMGDEWDYSGYGAKFWKRFSTAQRREMEGANKDSENFRKKIAKRRKYIMMMSILGGIAIIGGVAAIIIWRESFPSPATPGALDKENGGVNEATKPNVGSAATTVTTDDTAVTTTSAADAAATTTSTRRHHHNGKRAAATPMLTAVEQIKRDIVASAPSYYGGVHPLPRDVPAGDLIRRRKHAERALTTPLASA
jgi:hypothetical protein